MNNTTTKPTTPLSVMERAERFIAGFEGDTMQEGIDELLRDVRQLIQSAKSAATQPIMELMQSGIDAADKVVDCWESGNLATAVHDLEQWADLALFRMESFTGEESAPPSEQPAVVVVEITGGNLSGTTILGQARLLVLDYDNGEDDETCPEIPMRGGSRASIGDSGVSDPGTGDAQFVHQLLAVVDADEA